MTKTDVFFCCACGKVKDEHEREPDRVAWIDMRRYRVKYGYGLGALGLTKTFCPECAELYRKTQPSPSRADAAARPPRRSPHAGRPRSASR